LEAASQAEKCPAFRKHYAAMAKFHQLLDRCDTGSNRLENLTKLSASMDDFRRKMPRGCNPTAIRTDPQISSNVAAIEAPTLGPLGLWVTENGRSRIRISECGNAICGAIEWMREPTDPDTGRPKLDKNNADAARRNQPLIGTSIIVSMKLNGMDGWSGQVYNAEDGKTYSGSITMLGTNTLRLEGCALGGLICKGQNWTRAD
jgi:uncharacterized protein (DUF2147 family)